MKPITMRCLRCGEERKVALKEGQKREDLVPFCMQCHDELKMILLEPIGMATQMAMNTFLREFMPTLCRWIREGEMARAKKEIEKL